MNQPAQWRLAFLLPRRMPADAWELKEDDLGEGTARGKPVFDHQTDWRMIRRNIFVPVLVVWVDEVNTLRNLAPNRVSTN